MRKIDFINRPLALAEPVPFTVPILMTTSLTLALLMYPWPPPETASYESDPRIAEVDAHLSGVDRLIPAFKQMHPMGAGLPQECAVLTSHDFASIAYGNRLLAARGEAFIAKLDHRHFSYTDSRNPKPIWL